MCMTMSLARAQRIPPTWWPIAATSFFHMPWGCTHSSLGKPLGKSCILSVCICVTLPCWPGWGFPLERSHWLNRYLYAKCLPCPALYNQLLHFTLSRRVGVQKTVLQLLFWRQLFCFCLPAPATSLHVLSQVKPRHPPSEASALYAELPTDRLEPLLSMRCP